MEISEKTATAKEEVVHLSQFQLLRSRRLGPLFGAQFLGAFNDNVFKQALILLLVFSSLVADENSDLVINAAAALFILPFFLFSATAGTLADRFEKSMLIRRIKLAEIGISMLVAGSLYLQNVYLLLAVLFLLGAQSTFFGPLKLSILPQHLHISELIGGNGVIRMGTFVAILLGTLVGGVIAGLENVTSWLPLVVIGSAIIGYLFSLKIPAAPPQFTGDANWNPFTELIELFRLAAERKAVFRSILGVSWFWLLGSIYLTQIANLVNRHLNGSESVVTLILTVFTIATAIGSLGCERLSGRKVEIGLTPIGAIGVSVFGMDVYWAILAFDGDMQRNALEFLTAPGAARLLIDLAMMGIFTGLMVIPMQALIQARTPEDRRARVIAANNIFNSLFMVGGAGLAILWLTIFDFSIPSLLLFVAILNACVAAYICYTVPEFTMRFLIWVMSHTIYRVKHVGLDRIPDRGAAILVSNHVSLVDAVILAGAVRRPIRFVMYKPIYDIPVLNFIFRVGRAIPINPKHEDPEVYDEAFRQIDEGLTDGDLLCIFPEGRLTDDGEVGEFKAGIEKIISTTPAPVIPASLSGLWGSFFSKSGEGTLHSPHRFWSKIRLTIGEAVAPSEVKVDLLRGKVVELRGEIR